MKQFDTVAAKRAGMSDEAIQEFMAQNNLQPAKQSWLTEGQTGLKGAYRGFSNLMNLPSYAIGGAMRGAGGFADEAEMRADPITGEQVPVTDLDRLGKGFNRNVVEGVARGIPDKSAVFSEAPRLAGLKEGSLPAMAMGFGMELATPSTLSLLAGGGKALGLFDKKSKAADAVNLKSRVSDSLDDTSKAGDLKQKLADKLYQSSDDAVTQGLGRNKTMEQMLARFKAAGVEPSEVFDKYNLWSRDPDDVQKAIDLVDKKLATIARQSQSSVDVRDIVKLFDDEIGKLTSEAVESDTARIAQEVLADRKGRFLEKIQTNINGGVSTPLQTTLGDVYQTASRAQADIPQSAWNLGAADSAKVTGLKKTAGSIRDFVGQQTGGESQKLGQEMSGLINLKKLAQKAQTASAGNQRFPLKSIMGAGAGGSVAGIPGAVAGFAANQIAQSPTGAKIASKGYRMAGDVVSKAPKVTSKLPSVSKVASKAPKSVESVLKAPPFATRAVETGVRTAPLISDQLEEKKRKKAKTNYPSYY
jgi:hypothetical protein